MNEAIQTVPQEEPRNTEWRDGILVDLDTGEVIESKFQVCDQLTAEWALKRMMDVEAEIVAIDNSQAVIHARAILANVEAMKKVARRTLEGLHYRFDNELGEFARRELEGNKTRTLKTLYGSISLRKVKGKLKVKDEDAALRAAKIDYPHAIQTVEAFRISQLTDQEVAALTEGLKGTEWPANTLAREAFELVPDTEKVTITTGVSS